MADTLPALDTTTRTTRCDATREQIDAAIAHFFSSEHVAAITLAAAAHRVLVDVYAATGRNLPDDFELGGRRVAKGEFVAWRNEVYNWLHHADTDPDATSAVDGHESVYWLLCCLQLYPKVWGAGFTPAMLRFWSYVDTHVGPQLP